jgi:hypothetical protein
MSDLPSEGHELFPPSPAYFTATYIVPLGTVVRGYYFGRICAQLRSFTSRRVCFFILFYFFFISPDIIFVLIGTMRCIFFALFLAERSLSCPGVLNISTTAAGG